MNLYFFGWPSIVGGASTKFAHVLSLLAPHFDITVVPPRPAMLRDRIWSGFIESLGCRCRLWRQLPARLDGWAVAMCYAEFLRRGLALEAKQRGLRVAWSNDMMWHFPLELGALFAGAIDAVMYVSPTQRAVLEPGYRRAILAHPEPDRPNAIEGEIAGRAGHRLRWVMTDNYIDPGCFPFRDRFRRGMKRSRLVAGRLSRADPAKFPDNFPATYEGLGLRNPRFRVMGWSAALARRYRKHPFGPRWELLPEAAEDPADFLQSLDLYVYAVGPVFRESWGRAVVEAMLTGAVPLLGADVGHAKEFIRHGDSGFLCQDESDFGRYARLLQDDPERRRRMSRRAREWAIRTWCRPQDHLALWRRLFESS
jgi:glycosyltransferase involved in cell wall biosynthesis